MSEIIFRLKLFSLNLTGGFLFLFFLCLGSQNLSQRHELNLITSKTAPLPNGFLIGISFISGFISGGSLSSLSQVYKDE